MARPQARDDPSTLLYLTVGPPYLAPPFPADFPGGCDPCQCTKGTLNPTRRPCFIDAGLHCNPSRLTEIKPTWRNSITLVPPERGTELVMGLRGHPSRWPAAPSGGPNAEVWSPALHPALPLGGVLAGTFRYLSVPVGM